MCVKLSVSMANGQLTVSSRGPGRRMEVTVTTILLLWVGTTKWPFKSTYMRHRFLQK